jgi:thiamine monophosphate kinase
VLAASQQSDDLLHILTAMLIALAEHGIGLNGGHTVTADAMQIGMAVNGLRKSDLVERPPIIGDVLILTKPLGIGMIMAGLSQKSSGGIRRDGEIRNRYHGYQQRGGGGNSIRIWHIPHDRCNRIWVDAACAVFRLTGLIHRWDYPYRSSICHIWLELIICWMRV